MTLVDCWSTLPLSHVFIALSAYVPLALSPCLSLSLSSFPYLSFPLPLCFFLRVSLRVSRSLPFSLRFSLLFPFHLSLRLCLLLRLLWVKRYPPTPNTKGLRYTRPPRRDKIYQFRQNGIPGIRYTRRKGLRYTRPKRFKIHPPQNGEKIHPPENGEDIPTLKGSRYGHRLCS